MSVINFDDLFRGFGEFHDTDESHFERPKSHGRLYFEDNDGDDDDADNDDGGYKAFICGRRSARASVAESRKCDVCP